MWVSWHSGVLQTEKRISRQLDADHHIQYAEDRIDEACIQTDRAALLECVHDEIKAAQDHGRAQSDLDAQMAMALWAKIMTISTIAAAALSMFGLYLIWRSIDAVNETNAIMRQGQRPWLEFTIPDTIVIVDPGRGAGAVVRRADIKQSMIVKNFGTSPAIRSFCFVRFLDTNKPFEIDDEIDAVVDFCVKWKPHGLGESVLPSDEIKISMNGDRVHELLEVSDTTASEMSLKAFVCLYYRSIDGTDYTSVKPFWVDYTGETVDYGEGEIPGKVAVLRSFGVGARFT